MSEEKKEVKKHKAFSWNKNEDNTYSIVELEYTDSGEASVVSTKNIGRVKGRAILDLTKLLVKARMIVNN